MRTPPAKRRPPRGLPIRNTLTPMYNRGKSRPNTRLETKSGMRGSHIYVSKLTPRPKAGGHQRSPHCGFGRSWASPSLWRGFVQYRKRSLLLPVGVDLAPIISDQNGHKQPQSDAEKRAQSLIKKHWDLSSAVDELVGVEPGNIQVLEQEP